MRALMLLTVLLLAGCLDPARPTPGDACPTPGATGTAAGGYELRCDPDGRWVRARWTGGAS